jgi:RND family efflux transporter MFP subunit
MKTIFKLIVLMLFSINYISCNQGNANNTSANKHDHENYDGHEHDHEDAHVHEDGHNHDDDHSHDDGHYHGHDDDHSHDDGHDHDHEDAHVHEDGHNHDDDHSHDDGHEHDHEDAHNHEGEHSHDENLIVFSKSQAKKVNFKVEKPLFKKFGQTIKTVAKIENVNIEEVVITSKTSGIVNLFRDDIVEGKSVRVGNHLLSISSNDLADNNHGVKLKEAENNFSIAKKNFDRKSELIQDKIITEEEFLEAKREYISAKTIYDNLNDNFHNTGQIVRSSINGHINKVFVKNGQYVEAGEQIISISSNNKLILQSNLQQKYFSHMPDVIDANIKTLYNGNIYTLKDLNGKILSYGKSTTKDSHLIPFNIQIDNNNNFIPGSLVEVYLICQGENNSVIIPKTALIENQGSYYIFVQKAEEDFEKREVTIGESDGIYTEIKRGLSKEEKVVTVGAIHIKLAEGSGALDPHAGHVH